MYGCGSERGSDYSLTKVNVDTLVELFQQTHSDATIVGGMCKSGFVSLPMNCKYKMTQVDNVIFGIAFYGEEEPALTYVSRGIRPVETFGPWTVRESEFVIPESHFMSMEGRYMHV